MSTREKIAWVSLLSTLVIWVPYFSQAVMALASENSSPRSALLSSIVAVILQIVLSIGGGLAVAVRSRREPKDERDRAIEAAAIRFAYFLAISLEFATFIIASWLSLTHDLRPVARGVSLMIVSQSILLCLVVAESSRFALQILGYRRGA